jgi:hypothetical protein
MGSQLLVGRPSTSWRQADKRNFSTIHFLLLAFLLSLVVFWFIGFFLLAWNMPYSTVLTSVTGVNDSNSTSSASYRTHHDHSLPSPSTKSPKQRHSELEERPWTPRILSRIPGVVAAVTADVRGNLGPAEVVVQPVPGTDWLHDRWQAASDMHGKNIPGRHWIQLEFTANIIVDTIRLDWETAYASDYRIEGSMNPITGGESSQSVEDAVWTLYDGTDPNYRTVRSEEKSGRSPGVKMEMPLHIIHTIHPISNKKPVRYLRLYILRSATGWGVSLWQFDVLGFLQSDVVF